MPIWCRLTALQVVLVCVDGKAFDISTSDVRAFETHDYPSVRPLSSLRHGLPDACHNTQSTWAAHGAYLMSMRKQCEM